MFAGFTYAVYSRPTTMYSKRIRYYKIEQCQLKMYNAKHVQII